MENTGLPNRIDSATEALVVRSNKLGHDSDVLFARQDRLIAQLHALATSVDALLKDRSALLRMRDE
jgi:hypothetical protein